jgi:hypothetical protein
MTETKMDPIRPTVFEKKKNIVVVQSDVPNPQPALGKH